MMAIVWGVSALRNRYKQHFTPFHWRWAIVGISVFLIASDYVYLKALSDPDSLIAVVSTIRRAGTIIPFLYGILILHEKQIRAKVFCLIGVLIGLICLLIGTL